MRHHVCDIIHRVFFTEPCGLNKTPSSFIFSDSLHALRLPFKKNNIFFCAGDTGGRISLPVLPLPFLGLVGLSARWSAVDQTATGTASLYFCCCHARATNDRCSRSRDSFVDSFALMGSAALRGVSILCPI
jgi:hypothetical protein